MTAITSTNLILSFFLAGSLQQMLNLVNAMQVIVFTVLFNLAFPEYVDNFFGSLI